RVTVSGISSSSVGQARGEVQVNLHSTVNKASIAIHALVFPKVTGILPKYNCDRQPWTHLEGLQLADPSYYEPGPVDQSSLVRNIFGLNSTRQQWEFISQLPVNPKLAIQRLQQVKRRLANTPEQEAEYVKFPRQYESLDHMEVVSYSQQQEVFEHINYLSHHFVLKVESTTTEFREVFDAAAKTDLVSRGVPAAKLKDLSLWWQGPVWLSSDQLPHPTKLPESKQVLEERKKALLVQHVTTSSDLLQKYSSFQKLIRVTAYVKRFIKLYLKQSTMKGPLTCEELKEAELLWIRNIQQSSFKREIKSLSNSEELHRASSLKQLTPFIDSDGLLRASGRLTNSDLPYNQKFPIIIPHDNYLCKLIIHDAHLKLLHAGCQLLWSHLQQQYWITKAKSTIRNQIRKCIICRRYRADKMQQLMGSLPKVRVTPSPPFQNTGVDYAGPFNMRIMKGRSNKTFKAYFAIFVCMCTKAVHLEAVSDMTTEAFIAAFKRFTSRRGVCENMYSDCGSNFVGAEKELRKLLATAAHNDQMTNQFSTQGIKWHSTPHPLHTKVGYGSSGGVSQLQTFVCPQQRPQRLQPIDSRSFPDWSTLNSPSRTNSSRHQDEPAQPVAALSADGTRLLEAVVCRIFNLIAAAFQMD
ncbi:Pro-Pol polyprotein, partial [Orchesella cincta]